MWQTVSMPAHIPLAPPPTLKTAQEHLHLLACKFFPDMGACSTYAWASCKRVKASGNSPQPLPDGDYTSASLSLCEDNSEACISEIPSQIGLQPHTAVT